MGRRESFALTFERCPKRVRVLFGGQFVADSRRVMLLREPQSVPVYYFPTGDVRMDLLVPSDHRESSPTKGQARFCHLKVGSSMAVDGSWSYPDPPQGAPDLAGYVALAWEAMDAWYEEDEQVYVHARDPHKRVDVLRSSRHVVVRALGQVIAESQRPVVVFETGLPPRYYLTQTDVRLDLLVPSDRVTRCPYKGVAHYRSVRDGKGRVEDAAWGYAYPTDEARGLAGLLAFDGRKVELMVDGERVD
jgi:uncharacterized protein (DUF427 family)